jgi:hypothetical protein
VATRGARATSPRAAGFDVEVAGGARLPADVAGVRFSAA